MSNLIKSACGLMVVTMISKILGFFREIVLGYFYGTSIYSDVYITAMNIPLVVFSVIGGALATTFIPLYNEILEKDGNECALEFSNNILCIVIILSSVCAIFGYVFSEQLVKLFAIGFEGEKFILTVRFVRILMIGVLFIGLSNIMTAYLQIHSNFAIPGMVGIPVNIIIMITIFMSSKSNNIYILAIGALIGMIFQFVFQYPFAIKNGYKFKLKLNLKDKYIKKMIWLVAPVLIGIAVNQLNMMIDRSIASNLGNGVITALNNANKLTGFVMGMFISTIGTVIYPKLSKVYNADDNSGFEEIIVKSVNYVNLIVVPVSIGAIVLSYPIVKLLFERGAFNQESTIMTSTALIFYSIGMIGFGLRDVLSKVFYSLNDTKTPMINGIFAVISNIILNIVLANAMGYGGLALATSLSAIICIILLFLKLKKKIGYYGENQIISTFIKTFISSCFMGIITRFAYSFLGEIFNTGVINEAISIFTSILVGIFVYVVSLILMKEKEIINIITIIKTVFENRASKYKSFL